MALAPPAIFQSHPERNAINLLIHSNAPWAGTGYAQQCALFAPRLKEHFELGISSFFGLEGSVLPWNGIPVYPGIASTYGNDTILDHARIHFGESRNGLVFTLMDVWVLDPMIWRQMNVACWTPVDHEPLPEPILGYFKGSGAVPIAMSRFGEEQLRDAGLDPLYVPHAVDCEVYKPHPKDEAREATKMPKEAFIVGMVAANKGNPSRKCFSEAFQAFKLFQAKHPESKLYLHTEVTGKFDGVNLPDLIQAVGIPGDAVLLCDQYRAVHYPFSQEMMAKVYSSLDVLLAPSAGEGFGLPVIEAQACGVPVIVSDFSAQPELVGAGWKVEGRKVYTALKAWQFLPDVDSIVEGLENAFGMGNLSNIAREFAERYDIETVMGGFMLPVLGAASERFEDRKPMAVAA